VQSSQNDVGREQSPCNSPKSIFNPEEMEVYDIEERPNDKKHKAGQSPEQFAKVVANSAHQGIDSVASICLWSTFVNDTA
jgi:hypothetical protein